MCYRPVGASLVRYGLGHENLRVKVGTRIVFTQTAAFVLPAGTCEVGMCGFSPNFQVSVDNNRVRTTAVILPLG